MPNLRNLFSWHPGPFAADTLRGAAMVMVVLYHVIGSDPSAGLELSPPSDWRTLADILGDMHMPLFAALSGLVYAMKPVPAGRIPRFLWDKVKRLALPGAVAITVFAGASQLVGSDFAETRPFIGYVIRPYAHFWFLQAIFVVFAVLVVTDAISGQRAGGILFPLGLGLLLSGRYPRTDFLALPSAEWLLPFAALGVLFWRNRGFVLGRGRPWLGAAGLAALGVGLVIDWAQVARTGQVVLLHHLPENLAVSLGVTTAGLLLVPHLRWLAWAGAPSFVVFLYHPLFTSGTRRALMALGVQNLTLHVVCGLIIGVLGPVAIYVAAMQWGLTRRVIVGLRQ